MEGSAGAEVAGLLGRPASVVVVEVVVLVVVLELAAALVEMTWPGAVTLAVMSTPHPPLVVLLVADEVAVEGAAATLVVLEDAAELGPG